MEDCLYLGNMNSLRDWGHAQDFVVAQWLMLQQDKPEDFVIATGEQHSVREFVARAGAHLGMKLEWRGKGLEEQGIDTATGKCIVRVDPRYFRPAEVDTLLGDPTKARLKLGWKAQIGFEQLVKDMVQADLVHAQRDAVVKREGFQTYARRE
jgi:GDPmannose 4,6-dehydratase